MLPFEAGADPANREILRRMQRIRLVRRQRIPDYKVAGGDSWAALPPLFVDASFPRSTTTENAHFTRTPLLRTTAHRRTTKREATAVDRGARAANRAARQESVGSQTPSTASKKRVSITSSEAPRAKASKTGETTADEPEGERPATSVTEETPTSKQPTAEPEDAESVVERGEEPSEERGEEPGTVDTVLSTDVAEEGPNEEATTETEPAPVEQQTDPETSPATPFVALQDGEEEGPPVDEVIAERMKKYGKQVPSRPAARDAWANDPEKIGPWRRQVVSDAKRSVEGFKQLKVDKVRYLKANAQKAWYDAWGVPYNAVPKGAETDLPDDDFPAPIASQSTEPDEETRALRDAFEQALAAKNGPAAAERTVGPIVRSRVPTEDVEEPVEDVAPTAVEQAT
ncbi:hypothetical protein CALCODRAFT_487212, partial [Calocera cornea HHB12733]